MSLVAIAAAVALVGCAAPPSGQQAPPAASPSPATSAPAAAGRTEVVTTGDAQFASPTGNLGCAIFDTADIVDARCDIAEKRWQPPPKPADCTVGWGQGLTVGQSGPAAIVCAGDTVLGGTRRLAYGDALRVGRFLCISRQTGMACENTQTRHGFELSQASYRIF